MSTTPEAQIERHIERHEHRASETHGHRRERLEWKIEGLKLALACIAKPSDAAVVVGDGGVEAAAEGRSYRRSGFTDADDVIARVMMARFEEVEHRPVTASWVATFADMARAVRESDAVRAALAARDAAVEARVREAWDEGYRSGHSNAMRRMSDETNAPTTPNPYRIARSGDQP